MAAGRFAAPVPLAETILAGSILAEAGLDAPLGPMTVAPAHIDEGLTLARQGGGWALSGRATRVPWGARAGHVVVVADGGGAPMIALVAAGAAKIEADASLAREPRDTLTWSGAPVGAAASLGAGIAHQAHGAIGFTYEHSLHFVTRRLWSWRAEFGAENHWSVALGRQVAARGAESLWPHMTER